MKNDEYVFCPLVDAMIENIDCIENRDIVNGMFKESCLPQKYKEKEQWRDICKKCEWHNY